MEYETEGNKVLNFKEFAVENSSISLRYVALSSSGHNGCNKRCRVDQVQADQGSAYCREGHKKVFRLVDMDKSGAISQLVCNSNFFILFNVFIIFQELKLAVKYLVL